MSPRAAPVASLLAALLLAVTPGCLNTTVQVTVINLEFDHPIRVHLEVLDLKNRTHFVRDLTVAAGATANLSIPRTTGFFRWSATTSEASCSVVQDVGWGDYRWMIALNHTDVRFNFLLDDAVTTQNCGDDTRTAYCSGPQPPPPDYPCP